MPLRPRAAAPPFCPNPTCVSHRGPGPWRFKKKGFYPRAHRPRRVQRYRCQHCGRNFSSQTFAPTYWLRRPTLLRPLFWRVLACSAYRQIAREFGVVHATIQHQVERLGRHCLLLHEALRPRHAPAEPLVLDGFRSFEAGHYWPFDLNLLVGTSHFVYGFNEAELRRSGTLTPSQRRRRAALETYHGRPDPRANYYAVRELVARLVPPGAAAEIRSDQHPAYGPALRHIPHRRLRHTTTSSRAARTPRNPLFPVNLADLLLRHTGANHKRRTLAFSKRRQGALYRAAIWLVWRNYLKPVSERRPHAPPPGVPVGAIARRWTLTDVLRERRFPWRLLLSPWLKRCYFGRIPTRCLARCRTHRLAYAS